MNDLLAHRLRRARAHLKAAQLLAIDQGLPGMAQAIDVALSAIVGPTCDMRGCQRPPALGATVCLGHQALQQAAQAPLPMADDMATLH